RRGVPLRSRREPMGAGRRPPGRAPPHAARRRRRHAIRGGGLAEATVVPENTLWIYRDDQNRWESRAPLPAPRGASGVGIVSVKLVVVGGWGVGRRLVDSTAIYDPATNRWRNAAPIPTPRDHLTAVAVSGTLYAIGGRPLNPDRNYDVVEAYDPATDRWTAKSRMPSRRGGLAS